MPTIEHLFVLMLENRSFDHMLGLSGIPGINAPPAGASNSWNGKNFPVGDAPVDPMTVDPSHEFPDVLEQLCGAGAKYPSGGPYPPVNNSGFVSNFATSAKSPSPGDVMQCFPPARLPVLIALAAEFAVCDAWHCSLPGPTWPNRFFALGGSSAQLDHSPTMDEMIVWQVDDGFKYQNGSIFDVAALKRKIYAGNKLFALAHALKGIHIWDITGYSNFAKDVSDPNYPAQFTWIEPNYGHVTTDYVGGNSQHPLDGVTGGEALIKATYETLRNSPIWPTSMLVIIWDEHGGFYDHAAPPAAPSPGDAAQFPGANQNGFTFTQYGPRVPAVVISPLIPQETVDHTIYDHTSPLATLERLFNIQPLTQRDRNAAGLRHLASLPAARNVNPNLFPLTPAVLAAHASVALDALNIPAPPPSRPDEPVEKDHNLPGFIFLAAKTDRELASKKLAPEVYRPQVRARVARIRTRRDAHDYFEEVRVKLAAEPAK
jgi:phospholipase C